MPGQCLGTAHHVPGGARPHCSQFRRHRAFPCALLAPGRLMRVGVFTQLGRLLLGAGRGNRADRRRRGKRAGLKERTSIGTGRLMSRHQLRLLDESKTLGDTLGGWVGLCQRFSLHRERLTRESGAR
jgi:hypothetical protein